jgi:hypothetical protein
LKDAKVEEREKQWEADAEKMQIGVKKGDA